MLTRLWLVLSVPWSCLMALLGMNDPRTWLAFLLLAAFPWLAGPLILYTVRYVIYGHFSAQENRSDRDSNREYVDSHWAD